VTHQTKIEAGSSSVSDEKNQVKTKSYDTLELATIVLKNPKIIAAYFEQAIKVSDFRKSL